MAVTKHAYICGLHQPAPRKMWRCIAPDDAQATHWLVACGERENGKWRYISVEKDFYGTGKLVPVSEPVSTQAVYRKRADAQAAYRAALAEGHSPEAPPGGLIANPLRHNRVL